jgi:hypothetical protein
MGLKMPLQPNKAQEFKGWPIEGFDGRSGHPQSEGQKGGGPLEANIRAHVRHGHPDPRSSPDYSQNIVFLRGKAMSP